MSGPTFRTDAAGGYTGRLLTSKGCTCSHARADRTSLAPAVNVKRMAVSAMSGQTLVPWQREGLMAGSDGVRDRLSKLNDQTLAAFWLVQNGHIPMPQRDELPVTTVTVPVALPEDVEAELNRLWDLRNAERFRNGPSSDNRYSLLKREMDDE